MVKSLRVLVSLTLIASFISGCAARPEHISPAYVSPIPYSNCDCDQLRTEIMRVNAKVVEVTGVQERTANKDAVAMGVGLVVFWPALFFLATGDNRKEELARLKGEYDCLEGLAVQKQCDYAQELVEARKKREEEARIKKAEMEKHLAQTPSATSGHN